MFLLMVDDIGNRLELICRRFQCTTSLCTQEKAT